MSKITFVDVRSSHKVEGEVENKKLETIEISQSKKKRGPKPKVKEVNNNFPISPFKIAGQYGDRITIIGSSGYSPQKTKKTPVKNSQELNVKRGSGRPRKEKENLENQDHQENQEDQENFVASIPKKRARPPSKAVSPSKTPIAKRTRKNNKTRFYFFLIFF